MLKHTTIGIIIGISIGIIIISYLLLVNTSEAQHAYQCDAWLTELADKAVILDTLATFHTKNTTVIHIQELYISALEKYEKECISSGAIRMDTKADTQ